MPKFTVYLAAVASCTVEVEAEDREAAIEAAFESNLPYANIYNNFDLGDWELSSDLFPHYNKPEEDVEEIE